MKKQKVEIEIDVPKGCKFDRMARRSDCEGEPCFTPMFKEIKVIDLSCIVGSGIDCEFSQDGKNWNVIGGLRQIRPDPYNQSGATLYDAAHKRSRLACRVRQSPHVHFWGGDDKCPLPEGLIVKLYFRDAETVTAKFYHDCGQWFHHGYNKEFDVIAFEVLGVAECWRYEWEEE